MFESNKTRAKTTSIWQRMAQIEMSQADHKRLRGQVIDVFGSYYRMYQVCNGRTELRAEAAVGLARLLRCTVEQLIDPEYPFANPFANKPYENAQ